MRFPHETVAAPHPMRYKLPVPQFSLELTEKAVRQHCNCCDKDQLTFSGIIHKSGDAHAVYYAYLHPEEISQPRRMLSLTISMGVWGGGGLGPPDRDWVQIKVRHDFQMMLRDPKEAVLFGTEFLGRPLTREQVLQSPLKDAFFAVADFVVAKDPAVHSFLIGRPIDWKDRQKA